MKYVPFLLGWLIGSVWSSLAAAQLEPLTAPAWGQRGEWRITGLPAVDNPFDPDQIQVDAAITAPSQTTRVLPAFWYQAYRRALSGGKETVQTVGAPEWRLRFTPVESGSHRYRVTVRLQGQEPGAPLEGSFTVPPPPATPTPNAPPPFRGFVRLAANQRYFETDQGAPLPLIGACVCWHGQRGTYDYDDWFAGMRQAGENYARLWMAPWAFGLEAEPGTGTRYRLDRAWQLDYVFDLAEREGIYLMLCLDYHGMFETKPDFWGGNNNWPKNPYNTALGGPCANQNAFFTHPDARRMYQKRLRYLIGRYSASPRLLAWEFFNEIDNVYAYLQAADVARWHGELGAWLRAQDPYRHLITTSLTGSSDRPELWNVPALDFAQYHSYNTPQPATRLAALTESMRQRYQKPVLIGELGVNWQGWNRHEDPHLRGLRQGLWGGALGGSAGTSMSWWWENLHAENVYPLYRALGDILRPTGWGGGRWDPIAFAQSGPPPVRVGAAIPDGTPFTVTLRLNGEWGAILPGRLALVSPSSAAHASAAWNSFVHGSAHHSLRIPLEFEAWLAADARLVLRVNSVSSGAVLSVKAEDREIFARALPNRDGGYQVNHEYDEEVTVPLPAGQHRIEVRNQGQDWFYLDWIRVENALPATYATPWQPTLPAIGLQREDSSEALVYVIHPDGEYPFQATNAVLPLVTNVSLTLSNWTDGVYGAEWYLPSTGARVTTTRGTVEGGRLSLPLPPLAEDLAGRIRPAARRAGLRE